MDESTGFPDALARTDGGHPGDAAVFCPDCGKAVKRAGNFCPRCGEDLPTTAAGSAPDSRWWLAVASPVLAVLWPYLLFLVLVLLVGVGPLPDPGVETFLHDIEPAVAVGVLAANVLAPVGVYRERTLLRDAAWRPAKWYYLGVVPVLNWLVALLYVVQRYRKLGSAPDARTPASAGATSGWWLAVVSPALVVPAAFGYVLQLVLLSNNGYLTEAQSDAGAGVVGSLMVLALLVTAALALYGVQRERDAFEEATWRPTNWYYLSVVPVLNWLVALVYVVQRHRKLD